MFKTKLETLTLIYWRQFSETSIKAFICSIVVVYFTWCLWQKACSHDTETSDSESWFMVVQTDL